MAITAVEQFISRSASGLTGERIYTVRENDPAEYANFDEDAALAAMLASWVAEPMLTGPGAGGYLLVAGAGEEPILLDFFVEAPGRGAPPAPPAPAGLPLLAPLLVELKPVVSELALQPHQRPAASTGSTERRRTGRRASRMARV